MNPPTSANMREWIMYLVSAVLVPFVIQYLRAHAMAAQATAAKARVDKQATIMSRLREFTLATAADFAEKRFPALAAKIQAGELTSKDAVHAELVSWGRDLYKEAVLHFTQQDIDLVREVGDRAIDRLIESAANVVSPFPGMKTTNAIMQAGVPEVILTRGVQYVRENVAELTCRACVPPCEDCPLKKEQK